jgi:hypothetical protein
VRAALVLRLGLVAFVGVLAGASVSACRVPNPEHCSNQDQSGNAYCAGVNSATPFCSPCHEKNHGCLPFEPVSCEAYLMGESGGPGPGPGPGSGSDTSTSG